jgi:hypothetical protein
MGIGPIIATVCFLLLLFAFIMRGISNWRSRKTGTGSDVDLSTVGHRTPKGGGDIEPDTISKIERMLKEEANSDSSKV